METQAQSSVHAGPASRQPKQRTTILVGHARLPRSLAGSYDSFVVSVELEADMGTGIISRAAVMGIPSLGGRLLAQVLAGRNLRDGPQEAVEEIRRRYVCPSHKTLCTAVLNAYEAYHRYEE